MTIVWVIMGALLLIVVQEKLYAGYWDKNLSVCLKFTESSVTEGEECMLEERVENRKLLPLPALKVKFQVSRKLSFEGEGNTSIVTDQYYRNDVLSIRPYMRHVRRLTFRCGHRGFYVINGLDLVAGDLFLSGELPKSVQSDAQLYVYPRPYRGQDFMEAMQKLNGDILCKRHLLEDPFEYRGIREYSPQDSFRDINWKATARTGDFKINMKNYTAMKAVRLFLNLEDAAILRREELLELSISMAAGAAQMLLTQGIRTALYTNGTDIVSGEPVCLAASAGAGHMESVNRGLARINLDVQAPPFVKALGEALTDPERGAGEVFTVLFSADAREDFQELLSGLAAQRMDFVWICPYLPGTEVRVFPELQNHVRLICMREESGWGA